MRPGHSLPTATGKPTRRIRRRASHLGREGRTRGKYWWVRWVIIGVAVVVLAVEVVLVWDQLAKAWRSLLSANWWWVLAAVVRGLALDAQLRADPAHPAEVGRRRCQAVAFRRRRSTRAMRCRPRCRAAPCSRRRSCIGSNDFGALPRWWRRGSSSCPAYCRSSASRCWASPAPSCWAPARTRCR